MRANNEGGSARSSGQLARYVSRFSPKNNCADRQLSPACFFFESSSSFSCGSSDERGSNASSDFEGAQSRNKRLTSYESGDLRKTRPLSPPGALAPEPLVDCNPDHLTRPLTLRNPNALRQRCYSTFTTSTARKATVASCVHFKASLPGSSLAIAQDSGDHEGSDNPLEKRRARSGSPLFWHSSRATPIQNSDAHGLSAAWSRAEPVPGEHDGERLDAPSASASASSSLSHFSAARIKKDVGPHLGRPRERSPSSWRPSRKKTKKKKSRQYDMIESRRKDLNRVLSAFWADAKFATEHATHRTVLESDCHRDGVKEEPTVTTASCSSKSLGVYWAEILPLCVAGYLDLVSVVRLRQTCSRLYYNRRYFVAGCAFERLCTLSEQEFLNSVLPQLKTFLTAGSLSQLNFSRCCLLTDSFLKSIVTFRGGKLCRNLRALHFDFCYALTDKALEILLATPLPHLESLSLRCARSRDLTGAPFSAKDLLTKDRWPRFHQLSCSCTQISLHHLDAVAVFLADRAAELQTQPKLGLSGSLASHSLISRLGLEEHHKRFIEAILAQKDVEAIELAIHQFEEEWLNAIDCVENQGKVLHRLIRNRSTTILINAPCWIAVAEDGDGHEKAIWGLHALPLPNNITNEGGVPPMTDFMAMTGPFIPAPPSGPKAVVDNDFFLTAPPENATPSPPKAQMASSNGGSDFPAHRPVSYLRWTYPLPIAIRLGNLPLVECLLKRGAYVDVWGYNFATPLYIAVSSFRQPQMEVVPTIESSNAVPSSSNTLETNKQEITPLSLSPLSRKEAPAEPLAALTPTLQPDGGHKRVSSITATTCPRPTWPMALTQDPLATFFVISDQETDSRGMTEVNRDTPTRNEMKISNTPCQNATDQGLHPPNEHFQPSHHGVPTTHRSDPPNTVATSGHLAKQSRVESGNPLDPITTQQNEHHNPAPKAVQHVGISCSGQEREAFQGSTQFSGADSAASAVVSNFEGKFNSAAQLHIIQLLLHYGAPVDAPDLYSAKCPINAAIKKDNKELLETLISHGARINVRALPPNAIPPLIQVARRYQQKKQPHKGLIHLGYKSPLFVACELGAWKCAPVLLDHGADPHWTDPFSNRIVTPTLLVYRKNPAMLQLFVAKGAGGTEESRWVLSEVIAVAILQEDIATVRFLIQRYPDLLKRESGGMWSLPLIQASRLNKVEVIEELLKLGSDPNAVNSEGLTSLHLAAGEGHRAAIECLLKYGADANVVGGPDKLSPLHIAVGENRKDVVETLLSYGARTTIQNLAGETALMVAIAARNDKVALLIIQHANVAELDIVDAQSRSALLYAVYYGQFKVADSLVDKGVNCGIADTTGATPMSILREKIQSLSKSASGSSSLNKFFRSFIGGGGGSATTATSATGTAGSSSKNHSSAVTGTTQGPTGPNPSRLPTTGEPGGVNPAMTGQPTSTPNPTPPPSGEKSSVAGPTTVIVGATHVSDESVRKLNAKRKKVAKSLLNKIRAKAKRKCPQPVSVASAMGVLSTVLPPHPASHLSHITGGGGGSSAEDPVIQSHQSVLEPGSAAPPLERTPTHASVLHARFPAHPAAVDDALPSTSTDEIPRLTTSMPESDPTIRTPISQVAMHDILPVEEALEDVAGGFSASSDDGEIEGVEFCSDIEDPS